MEDRGGALQDRPVSIQVGGRTFATRLSTLRRFPEALLWRAYTFDHKGFDLVFWDRNPRVFESLLEYYRTNRLSLPSDVSFQTIKDELQFWGFDVEPPERPAWPVLPRYRDCDDGAGAAEGRIRYPLGIALRESASGCHYVLVCLIWSALGRSTSLWEVAQRGYRSISIYWKTRAPGIDSSIVRSHAKTLARLAEMDGCRIEIVPGVTTQALSVDVRSHDLYTHGHLHSTQAPTTVAEWRFQASYYKEGHELAIKSTASETLSFSFDHRGFRISLRVSGEHIWWYMHPLSNGEEVVDESVDVRSLENAQGFMLEVLFVIGRTVFSGFMMPSCYYRTSTLRADIFMGQTYPDPPADDAKWYIASTRGRLPSETCPFEFLETQGSSEATELLVLIEEKQNVSLVCHPAQNIVPYTCPSTFSPSAYDKITIEW